MQERLFQAIPLLLYKLETKSRLALKRLVVAMASDSYRQQAFSVKRQTDDASIVVPCGFHRGVRHLLFMSRQ